MIVVADTSVLLNLCQVGQVALLAALFRDVFIPPEVADEFARLAAQVPRFQGLSLPLWVHLQPASSVPSSLRSTPGLDRGEIAALALAVEIHADANLVDERRGHQAALQLGLKTVGVLGILEADHHAVDLRLRHCEPDRFAVLGVPEVGVVNLALLGDCQCVANVGHSNTAMAFQPGVPYIRMRWRGGKPCLASRSRAANSCLIR